MLVLNIHLTQLFCLELMLLLYILLVNSSQLFYLDLMLVLYILLAISCSAYCRTDTGAVYRAG